MNTEPKHWRCYFCDEVFTDPAEARQHFGIRDGQQPGCVEKVGLGGERGLLAALRRCEDKLTLAMDSVHDETVGAVQAMREMQHRHSEALRLAEEAGYARGLQDGKDIPF